MNKKSFILFELLVPLGSNLSLTAAVTEAHTANIRITNTTVKL